MIQINEQRQNFKFMQEDLMGYLQTITKEIEQH
jgi:hypothetical protein